MADYKIDSETANLIIQTYQKVNTLKKLLNDESYLQIMEVMESGKTLNVMINNTLGESSPNILQTKLRTISVHLKNLITYSDSIPKVYNNKAVMNLFNQLFIDISLLQSKIKEVN